MRVTPPSGHLYLSETLFSTRVCICTPRTRVYIRSRVGPSLKSFSLTSRRIYCCRAIHIDIQHYCTVADAFFSNVSFSNLPLPHPLYSSSSEGPQREYKCNRDGDRGFSQVAVFHFSGAHHTYQKHETWTQTILYSRCTCMCVWYIIITKHSLSGRQRAPPKRNYYLHTDSRVTIYYSGVGQYFA